MASTTAIYNSQKVILGSRRHPMAAATVVHAGNLVVISTSTGVASAGVSGASLRCVGRAAETVDNSAGSASDLSITSLQEPATFENDGTAPFAIGDIGLPAYIQDAKTVAKTIASNGVACGIFRGFLNGKCIVDQSAL